MFIELNNALNLNKPIENIDLLHLAMIFALNKFEKNNPKIAENKKILGNLVYQEKQNQLIKFYQYLFKYAYKDKKRKNFSIRIEFNSFIDSKLRNKFKSKKDKDLFYFFYEELKKLIDDTNNLNQANSSMIFNQDKKILLDNFIIAFDKLHGTGKLEDKSAGNQTMFQKPEGDNFGKICFLKISPFAIEDKENIKKLINKNFLKSIYNPYLLKYNAKKESKKVFIEYYANQFNDFLLYDREKFSPNDVFLVKLDDEYKKKFSQNSQEDNKDPKFAILEKFNTDKYNYGGILYDLKLEEKRENFKLYEIIKNNSFKTFLFQWILNYYIFANQDMIYFNIIAKFNPKKQIIKNPQIIDYECVFEKETSKKRLETIQKLGPYYSLMAGLIQTAHENHNFKRKIDFELLNSNDFNIKTSKIVQYYNEKGELAENKSQTLKEAIESLSRDHNRDRPHGKLLDFIVKNYKKEQIDEIFSEFFTIFHEKLNLTNNFNEKLPNYIDNFFLEQLNLYKIKNGQDSSLNEQGEQNFDKNFEDFINFIKQNVENLQEGIKNYNESKNKNQQNGVWAKVRSSFRLSSKPKQTGPRTNLDNQQTDQVIGENQENEK